MNVKKLMYMSLYVSTNHNTFIPVRKAGTRDGFPWINQEIRRLIRKRDKLYKRWSRSGRPYDHNKFLDQKHLVRRVSERAYEKYLGDILSTLDEQQY